MTEDLVADDEVLYRRILSSTDYLVVQNDGTVRISSQAFYESSFRPSVDRAKLRNNDPWLTLGSFDGGIASLVTCDVRSTDTVVRNDKQGKPIFLFSVDVEAVPILNDSNEADNPAHAEIYTIPHCDKKVFRKLCERLAFLANARTWEIRPRGF